jgi:hypothetical protein
MFAVKSERNANNMGHTLLIKSTHLDLGKSVLRGAEISRMDEPDLA